MQKNGVVRLKHPLKSIDEKSTVYWTTHCLTFPDMENMQVFMKPEHLYVASIPSHQNLRK